MSFLPTLEKNMNLPYPIVQWFPNFSGCNPKYSLDDPKCINIVFITSNFYVIYSEIYDFM